MAHSAEYGALEIFNEETDSHGQHTKPTLMTATADGGAFKVSGVKKYVLGWPQESRTSFSPARST